jgi:hypothetical protein
MSWEVISELRRKKKRFFFESCTYGSLRDKDLRQATEQLELGEHEMHSRAGLIFVFDTCCRILHFVPLKWDTRKKLVYREVKLMERICHTNPHIVKFREYIDAHTHLHLVMEEVNFRCIL